MMRQQLRYARMVRLLLLLVSSTACSVPSLMSPDTSLPTVPAHELLLDSKPFPNDWQVESCEPYCADQEGYGDAQREFFDTDTQTYNRVIQHVRRHRNEGAAAAEYQSYRETFFRKKPPPQTPSTDHFPPDEGAYSSPSADAYYFACGVDVVPICRVIARYKNYFVHMFFQVDTITVAGSTYQGTGMEGLAIEDIEPIVRALDTHVAAQLGQPPGTPAPTVNP